MSDLFNDSLHYLVLNLAKVLSVLFQQDSYFYWPYLLSSVVLAFVARRWINPPQQGDLKQFVDKYFSRRLWWHPSAQADHWLYLANGLVVPAVFALLLVDGRQVGDLLRGLFGVHDSLSAESS